LSRRTIDELLALVRRRLGRVTVDDAVEAVDAGA
jgi:hypothetical protein